jgi:hypothetical protein
VQRLCQYRISIKIVINQQIDNLEDFRFRAICMKGHRASCILRGLAGGFGAAGRGESFILTVQWAHKFLFPSGYKTFQILRVQRKNRWRIFLRGIRQRSYGKSGA